MLTRNRFYANNTKIKVYSLVFFENVHCSFFATLTLNLIYCADRYIVIFYQHPIVSPILFKWVALRKQII